MWEFFEQVQIWEINLIQSKSFFIIKYFDPRGFQQFVIALLFADGVMETQPSSSLLIWLRKRSPSCSIFLKSFMKNAGRRAEVGGSRGAGTHALSHHPPFIPPSTPPPPHPPPRPSLASLVAFLFLGKGEEEGRVTMATASLLKATCLLGYRENELRRGWEMPLHRSLKKKKKKSLLYVQIQQNTKTRREGSSELF